MSFALNFHPTGGTVLNVIVTLLFPFPGRRVEVSSYGEG